MAGPVLFPSKYQHRIEKQADVDHEINRKIDNQQFFEYAEQEDDHWIICFLLMTNLSLGLNQGSNYFHFGDIAILQASFCARHCSLKLRRSIWKVHGPNIEKTVIAIIVIIPIGTHNYDEPFF
jgi:hypothetical protein